MKKIDDIIIAGLLVGCICLYILNHLQGTQIKLLIKIANITHERIEVLEQHHDH